LSLADIGYWLDRKEIKNVIVVSGAGVSVSAGIPDFRTPGSGLYDNLDKYNLPFPEAVFDLNFFKSNPQPFCSLAKEIWPGKYCPTLTHAFIKLLQDRGILLRNYTQNIDGLEVLAGVDPDKVIECHGHFRSAKCVDCNTPFDADVCRDMMAQGNAPTCHFCRDIPITHTVVDTGNPDVTGGREEISFQRGLVKPDIVFFGESLPQKVKDSIQKDLLACDLLIVMGTSLTVYPVALLPLFIPDYCPRVLFNRELVGDFCGNSDDDEGDSSFRALRDVFSSGDCDDSVRELCQLSGWEHDLDGLYEGIRAKYGHLAPKEEPPVVEDEQAPPLEVEDAVDAILANTPDLTDEEEVVQQPSKKQKVDDGSNSPFRFVSFNETECN